MGNNIVFVILASLITGIATGEAGVEPLWSLLPAGGGLGTYFLLSRLSGRPGKMLRLASWHPLWVGLLFSGVGLFADSITKPTELPDLHGKKVRMAGRVEDIVSTSRGDRLLLDVARMAAAEPAAGLSNYGRDGRAVRMKALVTSDRPGLTHGDMVELETVLKDVSAYADSSDYARSLLRKGIQYNGFAPGEALRVVGHETSAASGAGAWRDRLERIVESSGLAPETRSFIITLLLGDKSFIDSERRDSFADAGVSHILAVSGMHVGLITAILLFLLYPMNLAGGFKWRYGLVIPLVWGYTWLTGMSAATVRAAVMLTFYFGALVIERRHSPIRALGWAAVLILIVSPRSLLDVGFQLSFLCVGSLIMFVGPLNLIDRRRHPRLHKLNSLILVTLVASLSSWVLSSYYFHRISLMFLPANMLAVPLLPVFISLVLLYFLLWLIGFPNALLGDAIDWLYRMFCILVEKVSQAGMAADDFTVGAPTVWLWVAAVVAGGYILNRRKGRLGTVVCVALFAVALVSVPLFKAA